tara:strand:- start:587 stop:1426 length:840 start_codon:yes stop_codon:yes gene_type:complete
VNFLLIGKGSWSHNYIKTVNKHPKAHLSLHIGARKVIEDAKLNSRHLKEIIEKYNISIIVLSVTPSSQIKILKLLLEFNGKIILEKPLFSSHSEKNFFKKLDSSFTSKIFVNHFHFFSKDFLSFIDKIKSKNLKKIHIYDYGMGPNRDFIRPIFDWGPHSLGIINYLTKDNVIKNVVKKKSRYGEKWFISLKANSNIKIKILTGNGFSYKKRRIIFYDNFMTKSIFEENQKETELTPMYTLIDEVIKNFKNKNNKNIDTYSIAFDSCLSLLEINNYIEN